MGAGEFTCRNRKMWSQFSLRVRKKLIGGKLLKTIRAAFRKRVPAFVLIGSIVWPIPSNARLCQSWNVSVLRPSLPTEELNEVSGLAVSRRLTALYFVNDSGGGPYFYVGDMTGQKIRKVKVRGWRPVDVEDLALGPCPFSKEKETCLALADIGDNRRVRASIEIVFVKELARYDDEVDPYFRLKLEYPDQAHDAEAMDLLPNGDVVIVTKERGKKTRSGEAGVYRFRFSSILKSDSLSVFQGGLQRIGSIDVPALTQDTEFSLVTGMSLTADGTRALILTYRKALELKMDWPSETSHLKVGESRVVDIEVLPQQEAIAYDKNDRDFLYSTEVENRILNLFGLSQKAPLLKASCLR